MSPPFSSTKGFPGVEADKPIMALSKSMERKKPRSETSSSCTRTCGCTLLMSTLVAARFASQPSPFKFSSPKPVEALSPIKRPTDTPLQQFLFSPPKFQHKEPLVQKPTKPLQPSAPSSKVPPLPPSPSPAQKPKQLKPPPVTVTPAEPSLPMQPKLSPSQMVHLIETFQSKQKKKLSAFALRHWIKWLTQRKLQQMEIQKVA